MAISLEKQRARPAPGKTRPDSSLKSTIIDQSGAGKIKIGTILSKEGYITSTQLEDALNYQKRNRGRLGSILVRLGYIDDETIVNALSRLHNYPSMVISKVTPDPAVLELMPYEMAKKYMAFPVKYKNKDLVVTMTEPTDTTAVADLQNEVKCNLQISVSTEKDVIEAYQKYYKISDEEYQSFFSAKEDVDEESFPVTHVEDFGSLVSEAVVGMEVADPSAAMESDQYNAGDAPIIKLVDGILIKAINEGVSDIHIEPFEKLVQVRYRVDGTLYQSMNLPITIKNALTSRIKILSGLNIAERRVPQDGRIKMRLGKQKTIDFRVSSLPTLFGESVVMRILDQSSLNINLAQLGFEGKTLEALMRCVTLPYGLVLVTGPTGSGKTTTLYSVLNLLNKVDIKILTAEDPVEFNFKGINQVLVKEDVGMTFAAALKSFLRQDPDIIMVGEIRDMETAEIAIKAAMTGHLVFSTLHTNDCPSTIGRLIDIGIPPYMLASAITMILSQRLARKLCPNCKRPVKDIDPKELENIGFQSAEIEKLEIYGPQGCEVCNGSGYKGRVGLYELMEVTDEVAKAISSNVAEDQLRKIAMQEGMATLREAGLGKVKLGATSMEEVEKRTVISKEMMPSYLSNPDIEHFADKEVIFREGDRDVDIFRLIQGSLDIYKGGRKIGQVVTPGEFFGERAAIRNAPRSTTVIARRRSVVSRIPGEKLPEIIEKYPEVAKHLFEVIAARLNRAEDVLINLYKQKKAGSK